jgi:uncharacterized protein (UPF0276 family)
MSPLKTGIGLRELHRQALLDSPKLDLGFLEVHSENYFGGGRARKSLKALAECYPISLHGVGLSLGRADGLDPEHLRQLKDLADDINPLFVSEHLSWSAYQHHHAPDLLPLPLNQEALDTVVSHIKAVQDTLGRQILIENPSNYLAFTDLSFSEPNFLNLLVDRTGCGLLLDINNIAVSAHNLGYDARAYIHEIIPDGRVKQIHLAGYQVNTLPDGETLYLDTHGHTVYPDVWALYENTLAHLGDVPTLIEWDTDIPPLEVLLAEATKADNYRAPFQDNAHDRAA